MADAGARMVQLERVDHLGIRVVDKQRSLAFYATLGFQVVAEYTDHHVVILRNAAGVEVNFIVNATTPPEARNVLMDVEPRYPGVTHVAFRVASLTRTLEALRQAGITPSEGPVALGDGMSAFIRDPDGTVIELRQAAR